MLRATAKAPDIDCFSVFGMAQERQLEMHVTINQDQLLWNRAVGHRVSLIVSLRDFYFFKWWHYANGLCFLFIQQQPTARTYQNTVTMSRRWDFVDSIGSSSNVVWLVNSISIRKSSFSIRCPSSSMQVTSKDNCKPKFASKRKRKTRQTVLCYCTWHAPPPKQT